MVPEWFMRKWSRFVERDVFFGTPPPIRFVDVDDEEMNKRMIVCYGMPDLTRRWFKLGLDETDDEATEVMGVCEANFGVWVGLYVEDYWYRHMDHHDWHHKEAALWAAQALMQEMGYVAECGLLGLEHYKCQPGFIKGSVYEDVIGLRADINGGIELPRLMTMTLTMLRYGRDAEWSLLCAWGVLTIECDGVTYDTRRMMLRNSTCQGAASWDDVYWDRQAHTRWGRPHISSSDSFGARNRMIGTLLLGLERRAEELGPSDVMMWEDMLEMATLYDLCGIAGCIPTRYVGSRTYID